VGKREPREKKSRQTYEMKGVAVEEVPRMQMARKNCEG
jgi:hypothetical protein